MVHSVVSPVTQSHHCSLSQADGRCSRCQVTWLEYLIHTGEERDQLFLSSAYLLPLYISTLELKSCEPGLHLNPSTAGQLSPLCISLTVKSLSEVLRLVHMFCLVQVNVSQECRPGQKSLDQRCL